MVPNITQCMSAQNLCLIMESLHKLDSLQQIFKKTERFDLLWSSSKPSVLRNFTKKKFTKVRATTVF